jgi:hypothetical protein
VVELVAGLAQFAEYRVTVGDELAALFASGFEASHARPRRAQMCMRTGKPATPLAAIVVLDAIDSVPTSAQTASGRGDGTAAGNAVSDPHEAP